MTIRSGDEVSDDSSVKEEVDNMAATLAERRKRWELPAHQLPTYHPRYKKEEETET